MRITLIGQAAFGKAVLEAILKKGWEAVGVYTQPDVSGSRSNPMKEIASTQGIPVFQPQRWRNPEVYESYKRLSPDLGVMAFVTSIIPPPIIELPRLGTIEYHPSLLPKHRGASAINWAIINGETKTGLTIFWPDAGIDTGPILLQKQVTIEPDDTAGSLYFNKLFPLGVEALIEAIERIEKGTAPRIPQDELQSTYESPCTEQSSIVDWAQPVQKVYNLIRGSNPQPGATTCLKGEKVKIFDCEQRPDHVGVTCGEVIGITEEGFLVSAKGGAILVKRLQPTGSPKITATLYATSTHLGAGSMLGSWTDGTK